ncbi:hypothetical protein BGZ73_002002 [Actinomortierella ambigua]|nr:hypothetical protein BGZ73_002002 [Actinomortierella ambigua]
MSTDHETADEQRLRELGYKQELKRELTSFTNFSVSFSVISILTGLSSLYGVGLNSGGPAVIIYGWIVVSFMTFLVALSWMNLVGEVAVTAGIDFGLAMLLCSVVSLGTGWVYERWHVVMVYWALLIVHASINTFAVKLIGILNTISVWVHIGGVIIILAVLAAKTPNKPTAEWVFTTFVNNTGWDSPVYVALIGLLQSQFTMTGYDASAHMSEETKNSAVSSPVGILMAVGVSFVAGLAYLLSLTFSIQNLDTVLTSSTGNAITQIFLDSVGQTGAILLLCILLLAQFFCGNASVTANSRMIYAFSRDNALPGSKYLHRIHPNFKVPVNAVWLAAFLAGLLGILHIINQYAFPAITSIATIALYISYVIPTFCRITYSRNTFERGPIHLGPFSTIIGTVACVWVAFITVLFVLPGSYPVTTQNMNWTIVILAAAVIFVLTYWKVSAHKWFKGPQSNVDLEESQFHASELDVKEKEVIVHAPDAETTGAGEKTEVEDGEVKSASSGDKTEL